MGEVSLTMLRIAYESAAVPEGGFSIACSPAAFVKAVGKEPAGKPFHEYAMRQAGLYGTPHLSAIPPRTFETPLIRTVATFSSHLKSHLASTH